MSSRNVASHADAHLAIRDLLDRYTNALNQRDWQALAALFAQWPEVFESVRHPVNQCKVMIDPWKSAA